MYMTNDLDKVGIIDRYWFNMSVEIMKVANHLYIHD